MAYFECLYLYLYTQQQKMDELFYRFLSYLSRFTLSYVLTMVKEVSCLMAQRIHLNVD